MKSRTSLANINWLTVNEIVRTNLLEACPNCGRKLREPEERTAERLTNLVPILPTDDVGIQRLWCQWCSIVWQLVTRFIWEKSPEPATKITLHGYDTYEALTIVFSCTVVQSSEQEKSLRRQSPSLVDLAKQTEDLPRDFRHLGGVDCLSAYQATIYVAHPELAAEDMTLIPHLLRCYRCLEEMAKAQGQPISLCPPRIVLTKAVNRQLATILDCLVTYHVWNETSGCPSCQHEWRSLVNEI